MKKLATIIVFAFMHIAINAQVQTVGIGSAPNDGTGDNLRTAFGKVNNNDSYIDGRIDTIHVSNTHRVSGGSVYTTIQAGINAASSGDVVIVYPGTYSLSQTINVADGVNIEMKSGANVVVTANIVGFTMDSDTVIIRGGKITVTGSLGQVFSINTSSVKILDVVVESPTANNHKTSIDSSLVTVRSSFYNSNFIVTGNSVVTANIQELALTDTATIHTFNESILNLNVEKSKYFDISGTERAFGYKNQFVKSHQTSKLNINSNDIKGSIRTEGNSEINVINSRGSGYCYVNVRDSSTVNFYNSTFIFDVDDQVTGLHLFETINGGSNPTINVYGGYFEYTGYNGVHDTYGAMCEIDEGTFNAYNCHIKDNGHDLAGYGQVIKIDEANVRIANSIIEVTDKSDYAFGFTSGTLDVYAELTDVSVIGNGLAETYLFWNDSPAPDASDTLIISGLKTYLKNDVPTWTYTTRLWTELVLEEKPFRHSMSDLTNNYVFETVTAEENGTDGDTIVITINYTRQDVGSLVKPVIVDPLYLYVRHMTDNTKGGFYTIQYFSQYYNASASYSEYTFTQKYERGTTTGWTPPADFIVESYNSTSIVIIGVNLSSTDANVYIQGWDLESVKSIELTTR
jgi:hypothetical protein